MFAFQLLLYNIIAPGYEQSINYGFSGGLFRADMGDVMGDSMAGKTTRLQTGSFLRGGERRNVRVCYLMLII
jgi:hypothetical protein